MLILKKVFALFQQSNKSLKNMIQLSFSSVEILQKEKKDFLYPLSRTKMFKSILKSCKRIGFKIKKLRNKFSASWSKVLFMRSQLVLHY